jgi:hypothetical protein
MKKIPTVYIRDDADRSKVTDEVNPSCQWVLDGEGVPTRKYDGTCVMLDDHGRWWARREVKPGKTPPPNYQGEQHDEVTGKTVGWEPIEQSPFVRFHAEALANHWTDTPTPGTYELIGPKIQGNPEREPRHRLQSHSEAQIPPGITLSQDPKELVRNVADLGWEGAVWHHEDGRMAKLKARDLGARPGGGAR